jgi:4-oxalmesaconate hydratase
MLIIDCHGHYTTAPEPHQKVREAQLVRIKDSTLPAPVPTQVSDDEIRESIEANQLRLQRERGADLTLYPARSTALRRFIAGEEPIVTRYISVSRRVPIIPTGSRTP